MKDHHNFTIIFQTFQTFSNFRNPIYYGYFNTILKVFKQYHNFQLRFRVFSKCRQLGKEENNPFKSGSFNYQIVFTDFLTHL